MEAFLAWIEELPGTYFTSSTNIREKVTVKRRHIKVCAGLVCQVLWSRFDTNVTDTGNVMRFSGAAGNPSTRAMP